MTYEDAKRLSIFVQKYDELGELYKALREDRQIIKDKPIGEFAHSYLAINSHGESLSYEIDADIVTDILDKISLAITERRGEYFHRINMFKVGETE